MAPNAMEYGAITSAAPVNWRMRNSAGSTNGLPERRQCRTNRARNAAATAKLTTMRGDVHPQSFTFTIANVSTPIPPVTSSAAQGLGRGTS